MTFKSTRSGVAGRGFHAYMTSATKMKMKIELEVTLLLF